jgi:hypothetical protein
VLPASNIGTAPESPDNSFPAHCTAIGWMLNDADGYQSGGEVEGVATAKVKG